MKFFVYLKSKALLLLNEPVTMICWLIYPKKVIYQELYGNKAYLTELNPA